MLVQQDEKKKENLDITEVGVPPEQSEKAKAYLQVYLGEQTVMQKVTLEWSMVLMLRLL